MTEIAHLLGEFIAAWNQGQRPRMAAYLERAAPHEREELADQIETFLTIAPDPTYAENTWSEMVSDPMVAQVARASMAAADPQPLPVLREQAGLSLAQLAARLGFSGGQTTKAEGYLRDIESGKRAARMPVLERIAAVLRIPVDAITAAMPTPPAAAPALLRTTENPSPEHDLQLVAESIMREASDWDEVDQLFLGGR